mmetsp:Transcript_169544/g.544431  ORF Transcript_169544/g.544431 Transcript_169544/m.544431 type:complete len:203 (-) Transcript_169544:213-821(-)
MVLCQAPHVATSIHLGIQPHVWRIRVDLIASRGHPLHSVQSHTRPGSVIVEVPGPLADSLPGASMEVDMHDKFLRKVATLCQRDLSGVVALQQSVTEHCRGLLDILLLAAHGNRLIGCNILCAAHLPCIARCFVLPRLGRRRGLREGSAVLWLRRLRGANRSRCVSRCLGRLLFRRRPGPLRFRSVELCGLILEGDRSSNSL